VATLALCSASLGLLAFAALPIAVLFWFMQPTVRANPGLNAYDAPPATRLQPLARNWELLQSDEQAGERSPATNFARAYPPADAAQDVAQNPAPQREARREVVRPVKQRRLVERRRYEDSPYAFAQNWNRPPHDRLLLQRAQ